MSRPANTYRAARRNQWRQAKADLKWTRWSAFNRSIQNAKP